MKANYLLKSTLIILMFQMSHFAPLNAKVNAVVGTCDDPPTSITNPSLNTNGATGGDMNTSTSTTINGWYVSHGSPSITTSVPSGGGATSVWLWSHNAFGTQTPNGEGIYTCYKFEKGKTYTVCFWVMNTNNVDSGKVMVEATNGLVPSTSVSIPNPSSFQIIGNSYFHSLNWTHVEYTFTALQDFNQLWIYPLYNTGVFNYGDPQYEINVDLIMINDCCPTINDCEFKPFFEIRGCNPIQFIDMSNGSGGAPIAWYWDFGDGTTSNLQNPLHSYTAPGTYHVCVTVLWMNEDRSTCSKQYCQDIDACKPENKPATNDDISNNNEVFIFPNPATDMVKVFTGNIINPVVTIYDLNGNAILSSKHNSNANKKLITLKTNLLHTGIYVLKVLGQNGSASKKLVIQ